MTEQQIPKLAASLVEHQASFASLPVEDGQWVIQNPVAAIELFVSAVGSRTNDEVAAQAANTYFRRLFKAETLVMPATANIETLATSGLFDGGVDGLTLPVRQRPTAASVVAVCEQIADGTSAEVFGSLGDGRRRWTEAQVCAWVRAHPEKLRRDNYGNLLEVEGGFVIHIYIDGLRRRRARVYGVSDLRIWHAAFRRRFVFSVTDV